MALLCVYKGAVSCTGIAQPGAKALMAWFLGAYSALGGVNSGIYNCRDIAGSTVLSLHAEGRAGDLGIRPVSAAYGWTLARALVTHSLTLGVQMVIWDRKIWSAARCDEGWRDYHGTNPHDDHLHVELSWDAARTLTVEKIQTTIGGSQMYGTIRKGATGDPARYVQGACKDIDPAALPQFGVDGDWGDETSAAVKRLFGGDGTIFGPDQHRGYLRQLAKRYGGATLVPHTHAYAGTVSVTGTTGPAKT